MAVKRHYMPKMVMNAEGCCLSIVQSKVENGLDEMCPNTADRKPLR